jgi:glycosyltransferase involved in cell wall biosynthesis
VTRILFVDHAPFLGGAQTVLADHVAHLDRTRYTPLAVCTEGAALVQERYRAAGAEVFEAPMRRLRSRSPGVPARLALDAARLHRLIRRVRAGLVVANSSRAAYLASVAAAGTGAPLIWWVHDLFYGRRLFRALAGRPAGIVFVSRVAQEFYGPRFGTETAVVHAGSALPRQLSRLTPQRIAAERARWGIGPDEVVVGFMGRLVEEKGPEDLVTAIAALRERHPRVRLLMVGTGRGQAGDVEEKLRHRVRAERLAEVVSLTGYQADEALYYSLFDLCVLCSRAPESFGMTLVQAMMAGKPVVATSVGGPSEVIEHGRTGLLVPPANPAALAGALRELLDDPQRAQALACAGRTHALAHHRVEAATARMEAFYARVLDGARRGRG